MRYNNGNEGCFVFLLILAAVALVIQAIGAAIKVLIIVVLSILAIYIAYKIIVFAYKLTRSIYYLFNPKAKKAYLENKEKHDEDCRKRNKRERAEEKFRREREETEIRKKEAERLQHRDGDQQTTFYIYQIDKHGNESLAIRYGIANQERKVKEYWYHAKGGERTRNPERDTMYYEPARTIRLQKIKKVSKDLYEVLLTDYRNRKARAVIEVGTEYVKTFYPLEDNWFEKHADLERTLKGNGTFTLKELATFHVQKTVGL